MFHLLKILEIEHIRDGKVIWQSSNILNTTHLEGEKFILSCMFRTTSEFTIPSFYYLGLDNRAAIEATDNITSITTEPTGNGYSRQPVSSATGFTVESYTVGSSTHWRARSQTVSFGASGSQWGPVSNVFLTDRLDNTGVLISSAPLGVSRYVSPSDSISFRFALSLTDPS